MLTWKKKTNKNKIKHLLYWQKLKISLNIINFLFLFFISLIPTNIRPFDCEQYKENFCISFNIINCNSIFGIFSFVFVKTQMIFFNNNQFSINPGMWLRYKCTTSSNNNNKLKENYITTKLKERLMMNFSLIQKN